MESRLKLRISRMFRASFGSCRSRNLSDVIEKEGFVSQNSRDFHGIEPILSPKARPFPSICRPRWPETTETVQHSCIVSKDVFPRRKVSDRNSLFVSGDTEGRMCPPASPISPLNTFYEFQQFESKDTKKNSEKKIKKKKKTHTKNKKRETYPFSSSSADTNGGWFSSEEEVEDETETLFSSKSLSSDSYESHRPRSRRKMYGTRRRSSLIKNSEMDLLPVVEGKVKDSFAVVKRSSDPYSDFRTSMVEMIVEKQIFGAKDLEQLLQCFLSLNSSHHHRVIVEVFTEIWEALFSDWS